MINARSVVYWLYTVCGMIFMMAVIGAITRLTESGLSITEWHPISGAIPPLNDADWQDAFQKYQTTDEYKELNLGMDLAAFKTIFFWEWFHRLWGRLIGLVFVIPLVYFWVRGLIPSSYKPALFGLLALGGLQGLVGWWMVKSGLSGRVDVSQYRLATHLGLALFLYSCTLWTALNLRRDLGMAQTSKITDKRTAVIGWHGLVFLGITIIWGALVAGMNAGLVYNTWPLMDGHIIPPEVGRALPISLFADHGGVNFMHRWLGVLTGITLLVFAWRVRSKLLGGVVVVQVVLGIVTLLTHVHLHVAVTHQANAILLLGLTIINLHAVRLQEMSPNG